MNTVQTICMLFIVVCVCFVFLLKIGPGLFSHNIDLHVLRSIQELIGVITPRHSVSSLNLFVSLDHICSTVKYRLPDI